MQTTGAALNSLSESSFLIERSTIEPALNRVVTHDGSITHLEPKVMQLVLFMAERPDEVLSRETLLTAVWGDAFVSEQVLTNAISQIRHSFGEAGRDYIQTIPKKGYRLTARVMPTSSPTSIDVPVEPSAPPQRRKEDRIRRTWTSWTGIFTVISLCVLAGIATYTLRISRSRKTVLGTPEIAIAVLPFQNLGGEKERDYLRFALSDRIRNSLTYSPSLALCPSSNTKTYATANLDAQMVGRKLRVSKVLMGEFLYEEGSLRISVELVDVNQNRVEWRSTVIAPAATSLDLDRQLTLLVRDQLLPALKVTARPEATHPRNPEAYDLYLRSVSFNFDPIPNKEALRLLDRSVTLDPNYAPAWEALGVRCYVDSRDSDGGEAAFSRAEMAREQALKLDPNMISSARALILMRIERGHLNEAWVDVQRLSRQYPDAPATSYMLSYALRYAGLDEEAARFCDRAIALDTSKSRFITCADIYSRLGDYEKAARVIRERETGTQFAFGTLGDIYLSQGNKELALQNLQELHDFRGTFITGCIKGTPDKRLAEKYEAYATDNDPEVMWAASKWLSYCGETDRAVRLIRSAIAHNCCLYPYIEREPLLANVRSRPEYSELRAAAMACQQNFVKFRESLEQK